MILIAQQWVCEVIEDRVESNKREYVYVHYVSENLLTDSCVLFKHSAYCSSVLFLFGIPTSVIPPGRKEWEREKYII